MRRPFVVNGLDRRHHRAPPALALGPGAAHAGARGDQCPAGGGPLPQCRRAVHPAETAAQSSVSRRTGSASALACGPSASSRPARRSASSACRTLSGSRSRGRGRGRLAPSPARLGQRIRHRGRAGRACRRTWTRPRARHCRHRPGKRSVDRRRRAARPRPRADASPPTTAGGRVHLRAGALALVAHSGVCVAPRSAARGTGRWAGRGGARAAAARGSSGAGVAGAVSGAPARAAPKMDRAPRSGAWAERCGPKRVIRRGHPLAASR